MGYNSDSSFTPDNTDTYFYILMEDGSLTLEMSKVLQMSKDYFGEHVTIENICIAPEYIRTHCLWSSVFDRKDYDYYIRVTLKE